MFAIVYILFVVNVLFFLFNYIAFRLNGEGVNDSVFYHILNPMGGAGFNEFVFEFFIVFSIIAFIFLLYFFLSRKAIRKKYNLFFFICFLIALFFNPGFYKTFDYFNSSYFKSLDKPGDYLEFEFHRNASRNLFFVYLESLENTYTDENVFPGLTPNINYFKSKALSFENVKMPTGSEWTIAGMVASQCGIPLVASAGSGNSLGQSQKFLPKANCLGDVLKNNGYVNYYYGGADTNFAGKKNFYNSHGFDNIFGLNELRNRSEVSALSSWGVYDDDLFNIVSGDFEKIDKSKSYSWVTLNLDTHHPFGHVSPSCKDIKYRNGDIRILNAVHCTDHLLRNFVDSVIASDPQAIIVIASDHLAMPNDAKEILEKEDRRNLFFILGSEISARKIDDPASTYDIAPTVLSLMGLESEGMGWGRNLLKNNSLLSDFSDVNQFNNYVKSYRGFHKSFYGYHQDFKSLKKDGDYFLVNDEKIKLPFAIKLNRKNHIEDIFFPGEGGFERYLKRVIKSNSKNNTIYVDECRNISLRYNNKDTCYLINSYRWGHDKGGIFNDDLIIDENLEIVYGEVFEKIEKNINKYLYRDAEFIFVDDPISVKSEAYAGGQSWVNTEKGSFNIDRGIGFYSFDNDGNVERLDFKDFCDDNESTTPSEKLMNFLHGEQSEYNQFIYVVHDSAWCLKERYDEFVRAVNFPMKLEEIDFRESAVFIKSNSALEFMKSKKKVVLLSNILENKN